MRRLSANGPFPVVAVDYSATGRSTGSFVDLGRLLAGPVQLWLTDPPVPGGDRTGDGIVERWVDEAAALEHDVVAVLGFCTGAVYATEIARRLAATQARTPALLLLEPEGATDGSLIEQFDRVLAGKLSAVVPEDRRRLLVAEAHELAAVHSGAALADRLAGSVRLHGRNALVELGTGERMADELCTAIAGYLGYLGGAVELGVPDGWATSETVRCAGADPDPAGPPGPVPPGREHRVPVAYPDLLRSPRTAAAVDDWLARVLSGVAA